LRKNRNQSKGGCCSSNITRVREQVYTRRFSMLPQQGRVPAEGGRIETDGKSL